MQQRLHTNDLSGTLIDRGWASLVIPAVATEAQDYAVAEGEVHHRLAGELLQPDRDSPDANEEIKRNVGSRIFAAQYQQNPTPPDGNMIKASWLARYQSIPPRNKFQDMVLSCDPAGKNGVKNDYTALTVMGIDKKELYLLHIDRAHWTVLEMGDRIKALASKWEVTHVCVEDTATGMGLIQILREQTRLNVIGRHPKEHGNPTEPSPRTLRGRSHSLANRGSLTSRVSCWHSQTAVTTIRLTHCCYF